MIDYQGLTLFLRLNTKPTPPTKINAKQPATAIFNIFFFEMYSDKVSSFHILDISGLVAAIHLQKVVFSKRVRLVMDFIFSCVSALCVCKKLEYSVVLRNKSWISIRLVLKFSIQR